MIKKILKLAAVAAMLLQTGSCIKDPGYLVLNDQTTGDIIEGRFLSDQGLWYDVVEQTCDGNLADCKRALVVSDILRNTSTSKEASYEIRLKEFLPVGLPDVVTTYEGEQQDPVLVDLAWVAGRYLNLRVSYFTKEKSEVAHAFKIALVQAPTAIAPLTVRVLHDAGGEYLGAPEINKDDLIRTIAFLSIPINGYYEGMTDYTVRFEVEYPWHKTADDGGALPETEIFTLNGNLYR